MKKEFLEFECHLELDVDLLKGSGIPYKYCVYGTDCSDMFEYLHGAPGRSNSVKNRCLKVNNKPGKSKKYIILFLNNYDQCPA